MFQHCKKTPWTISLDIAKEIGRRGFPAEAKPLAARSAMEDTQRFVVIIPGRGIAVIDDGLNVVVASSNKLSQRASTFKYECVETAAENILRSLPLP